MTVNYEHITRNVRSGLTRTFTDEAIRAMIEQAVRTLGNLVHYQSERRYYDSDIIYLTRVLLLLSIMPNASEATDRV